MKPGQLILKAIARALKVPPLAVEMFTAANQASGLDTKTLPTELIPLNSIQLSRGLLNFTILQAARDWILPYWAEQQYNPASPSFIPRSHLGLSINVTNRNWTAVGNPDCSIEPIIDSRGLVTPFRNGWSIDVWLTVDGQTFFPSRSDIVEQTLVENLPIVQTRFTFSGMQLHLTTYTENDCLFHRAEIRNASDTKKECMVVFAVRPFNPEGISLIHDLTFIQSEHGFQINDETSLFFSHPVDIVALSTFENGDCSTRLNTLTTGVMSVQCAKGMANGVAGYKLNLDRGESVSLHCSVALAGGNNRPTTVSVESATSKWDDLLANGTSIITPSTELNAILTASLSSVLMLTDGTDITPGPSTYHQFWFRDAAYMLSALDKFGYSAFTAPIIRTFSKRQESSGFFRSQQGEWDSNGQALWTVWQHALHADDKSILNDAFSSLCKGVEWIEKKRLTDAQMKDASYYGLLPAGLSAEHLGLVDYYFWDNAWSIAGIAAYIKICGALGRHKEQQKAERLLQTYRTGLERAIGIVQQRYQIKEIPASPTRGMDCGMIGSCCFWYPLQILPPDDARMIATLNTLMDRFSVQGMFFQDFVHSGMNPYLTLQIAQAALFGGKREVFWKLLTTTLSRATSTLTFPEAIHPVTGGGSMGDGHHGWVCAEILHSVRDAFVQERWTSEFRTHELLLCSGIPSEWFQRDTSFALRNAPVPEGRLTITTETTHNETTIKIDLDRRATVLPRRWILRLPIVPERVLLDGKEQTFKKAFNGEIDIELEPRSSSLRILHSPRTMNLFPLPAPHPHL